MAEIYGQASRVIVYLGEAADDSNLALEAISISAENESTDSPISEKIQEAIIKLLERPWFRRIWFLQEVAAARRIVIMCGRVEIDGWVFCSGINKLESSYRPQPGLKSLIRSVTYLIRGAIFRSRSLLSPSRELSLGELVDMYHTHEATERHDKVFALLGMSSDDPSAAGLSFDYGTPWKKLLQQLVKHVLFEEASIDTWDKRETAVIKSGIYIFGQVSSVKSDSARSDRQHVKVLSINGLRSFRHGEEYVARWTLQASAKPIQRHDFFCLLKGASKPAIIRRFKDHFAVIVIAVTLRQPVHIESGHFELQELLASAEDFAGDFLLVRNWEQSSENVQELARYESSVEINTLVQGYLETDSKRLARLCDLAVVWGALDKFEEAEDRVQEAMEECKRYFGEEDQRTLASIENRALLYDERGKWENAEHLLLQVIQIRKRVQGIDHQDTRCSIANLASIYIMQGDCGNDSRQIISSLAGQIRDNVQITEEGFSYLAEASSVRMMKLLLELKKDNVPVTEKVVIAASMRVREADKVVALLFDQRGDEVNITEGVLKSAATNWQNGKKVMVLFLKQRGDEIKITKKVLEAAAGNIGCGEELMALFLKRRGNEVRITEEVLKVAAQNKRYAKELIELFFKEYSNKIKITEKVLKAAARNRRCAEELVELFLDQRSDEIKITEEVLKAAAQNERCAKELIELFLKECGDEIKITEEVLKAAAVNWHSGEQVIALLLDQHGNEIKITAEVAQIAAGNWIFGTGVLAKLLRKYGHEIVG